MGPSSRGAPCDHGRAEVNRKRCGEGSGDGWAVRQGGGVGQIGRRSQRDGRFVAGRRYDHTDRDHGDGDMAAAAAAIIAGCPAVRAMARRALFVHVARRHPLAVTGRCIAARLRHGLAWHGMMASAGHVGPSEGNPEDQDQQQKDGRQSMPQGRLTWMGRLHAIPVAPGCQHPAGLTPRAGPSSPTRPCAGNAASTRGSGTLPGRGASVPATGNSGPGANRGRAAAGWRPSGMWS